MADFKNLKEKIREKKRLEQEAHEEGHKHYVEKVDELISRFVSANEKSSAEFKQFVGDFISAVKLIPGRDQELVDRLSGIEKGIKTIAEKKDIEIPPPQEVQLNIPPAPEVIAIKKPDWYKQIDENGLKEYIKGIVGEFGVWIVKAVGQKVDLDRYTKRENALAVKLVTRDGKDFYTSLSGGGGPGGSSGGGTTDPVGLKNVAGTTINPATEDGNLASIKTAVEVIDNFISGARGLVTEDNSAAIKTALEIIDDWDETDRAKVNPVVGQAGVAAGAGAVGANTQRVTLASDDPAVTALQIIDDWDNAASDGVSVSGDVAHDSPDAGEPVKIGGKASTTAPTAVAVGDRVNAWFDTFGKQHVAIEGTVTVDIGKLMGTGTNSVVAPTGTSATVLASNASRQAFMITNNGTVTVYLQFGATATVAGSFPLLRGQTVAMNFPGVYTGIITGITGGSTGDLRVVEFTT